MAYDARAIANAVLSAANSAGLPITNLALNKILYFSHGWYLALKGEPLVNYPFEAWEYGPVLPTVYHQFKRFGDRPITGMAVMVDVSSGTDVVARCDLPDTDQSFIERMVAFYGVKSGGVLSMMSHEPDAPWAQIRNAHPKPGMVISDDSIRAYFEAKLATGGPRSDAH